MYTYPLNLEYLDRYLGTIQISPPHKTPHITQHPSKDKQRQDKTSKPCYGTHARAQGIKAPKLPRQTRKGARRQNPKTGKNRQTQKKRGEPTDQIANQILQLPKNHSSQFKFSVPTPMNYQITHTHTHTLTIADPSTLSVVVKIFSYLQNIAPQAVKKCMCKIPTKFPPHVFIASR